MATITPPTWGEMSETDRQRWATAAGFHWDDLVSYGYVDGGERLSYGCTVTDLDAADGEVAFNESILAYPAELSASTVYLVSSSVSDTSTFTVHGIDANGDFATAQVTATGTTPAAISGTWNHIQRCISDGADNVGTVYVSTDAGALPTTLGDQIQTVMLPGTNYAINPMFVCPNNWLISITRFDFNTDTKSAFVIEVEANRQGRWLQNFLFYAYESQFAQDFHAPVILREGDKIRVKATLRSGTGADATFGMNGIVLRNDQGNTDKFSVKPLFEGN